MKKSIYLCLVLLSITTIVACDKSNQNGGNDDHPPITTSDHTFTFTLDGNEFNNITLSGRVPNNEAFAIYSPTPEAEKKAIMFSASVDNKSIIANFIRKNGVLLPLGEDSGDESNFNHSIIVFMFTHNGQSYALQSESGTCTEERFQIHSTGSMVSVKAKFSGTFTGGPAGTNDPKSYQVSGEVDVHFQKD